MKSELVRATGAVTNFIGVLNEELVRAGGHSGMIYFAQAKHAQPLMALLAKTIVESKLWKIPRSLILGEIRDAQKDLECLVWDEKWAWATHSRLAYDLTTIRFVKSDDGSDVPNRILGIPHEVQRQVTDSGANDPVCIVNHEGVSYVVTLVIGWERVDLAPLEYFDLEN